MEEKLTRDEIIRLVGKLMNAEGTEKEMDEWLRLVELNVPDAGVSDIIFWPNVRHLPDNLTAEEVVDIAFSYKPIILGPAKETTGDAQEDS